MMLAHSSDVLFHVLLALFAIVVLGRALGQVCRWLGQPPVIGEVVAGILLGPSLLGRMAPAAADFLLPPHVAPFLGVLAQLGVILYMFLVGLEMNAELLRAHAGKAWIISQAGIVAPFLLGVGLALLLYENQAPAGVPLASFVLFLGIAMAITAFPVLARILADRGLTHTDLGVLALTCAAMSDVAAWCLLAVVVGVAQSDLGGAALTTGLTLLVAAVMFVGVRPLAKRLLAKRHGDSQEVPINVLATVLVLLLLAALTTEVIGVHALFGAFLFGAVIPHDAPVARALKTRLADFVAILLLPAFFAYSGMRTEIGLLDSPHEWLLCGAIIGAATFGKIGGTFAAARWTGLASRDAAVLGVLMNTRGLMELIVLNVGLDLGVISPTLYAMMVLMALVTTLAAAPILQLLERCKTSGAAPT